MQNENRSEISSFSAGHSSLCGHLQTTEAREAWMRGLQSASSRVSGGIPASPALLVDRSHRRFHGYCLWSPSSACPGQAWWYPPRTKWHYQISVYWHYFTWDSHSGVSMAVTVATLRTKIIEPDLTFFRSCFVKMSWADHNKSKQGHNMVDLGSMSYETDNYRSIISLRKFSRTYTFIKFRKIGSTVWCKRGSKIIVRQRLAILLFGCWVLKYWSYQLINQKWRLVLVTNRCCLQQLITLLCNEKITRCRWLLREANRFAAAIL